MLKVSSGMIIKPQKVVIYGPSGIGKTTFAAKFPDPVFIDTEGGTNLIDVKRLEGISSWAALGATIREIKNTPDFCKTLVIDTIDWAEMLCHEYICSINQKKSIEDFGYGKGFILLKEEIGRFLNALNDLLDVGINVVLVAHSIVKRVDLPEENGSYDRYELKLTDKSGSKLPSLIKEWADMVLFVNYKQFVVETDKKKKVQGGQRVMYTNFNPCWDAKNRHDLKPELPFDYEQIGCCIPENIEKPPAVQETHVYEQKEEIKTEVASKETVPIDVPSIDDNLKDLPKALVDLMKTNNVSIEEIQKVVAIKGYYPKDTPLKNYDDGFINGVLIGAWEQVFNMIKTERELPIN